MSKVKITETLYSKFFAVDGFTYGWGVIHDELVKQLDNDVGTISLINSIMVGVTLCSGIYLDIGYD